MSVSSFCSICHHDFNTKPCHFNRISNHSQKTIYEILEFSGIILTINEDSVACEKCIKKVKSYDEYNTKAQQIKEELCQLINTNIELVIKKEEENTSDVTTTDIKFDLKAAYQSELVIGEIKTDTSEIGDTKEEIPMSKYLPEYLRSMGTIEKAGNQLHPRKNKKPIICPVCLKIFKKKLFLEKHSSVHVEERNFKCTTCGKAFKSLDYLKNHKILHETKKYQCDLCGRSFSRKRNVSLHCEAIHIKQRNFLCNLCSKTYASYTSLKSHLQSHEEIRKETCPICKKGFQNKYRLVRHIRTHQSTGSFMCNICSRSFKEKYALKEHVRRVHIGEHKEKLRKFCCNVCDSKFVRKDTLQNHLKKHDVVSRDQN